MISRRDTAASCSAGLAVNSSICPRGSEIPSLALQLLRPGSNRRPREPEPWTRRSGKPKRSATPQLRKAHWSRAAPSRLRQAGLPRRLGAPHRHLPTRRDQPALEGDPAGRPPGPLCALSPRRLPGLHRPALLRRQRRRQGAPPHLDAPPTTRGPKPGPRRTGNTLLAGPLGDARGLRGHRLRDRPRPWPAPLPLSRAGEGARPTRPHRRRHQHRPSQRVLPSRHRAPSPSPTCHLVPTFLPEHRTPAQQLMKRRSPTASRGLRGRSCRGPFQGKPATCCDPESRPRIVGPSKDREQSPIVCAVFAPTSPSHPRTNSTHRRGPGVMPDSPGATGPATNPVSTTPHRTAILTVILASGCWTRSTSRS